MKNSIHWIVLGASLLPSLCLAQTFGGRPALPFPEGKRAPVQVTELSLSVTATSAEVWHVKASMALRSQSKRPHELKLVLPTRRCDVENETCRSERSGQLQGLKASLNGAPVAFKRGEMPAGPEAAEAFGAGHAYRLTVPLKKKGKATLELSYQIDRSRDREGDVLDLLLSPVGRWWGPIKRASMTLQTNTRPWTVGFSRTLKLKRYQTTGSSKGRTTTLDFKMRRWRPPAALQFHLGTAFEVGAAKRCPDVQSVVDGAKRGGDTLQKMLVMRTPDELRRCRKVFFALYGFLHEEADKVSFYGKPVWSSSPKNTITTGERNFWRFGLQPNPTYTRELHPKEHLGYIKALASELERRGEAL